MSTIANMPSIADDETRSVAASEKSVEPAVMEKLTWVAHEHISLQADVRHHNEKLQNVLAFASNFEEGSKSYPAGKIQMYKANLEKAKQKEKDFVAEQEAKQAKADPISLLMQQALDGVVSVPWTLMLDKWRSKVFSGETAEADLNNSWWELREFYQGIGAPRDRDADAFDPGAKYHIPGNTPYTRYYLAKILQYQFHESLCYQMDFDGPLHECSIYDNDLAGEKLRAMLALGQSKDWQTALEALTGTRELSGKSMLNYYKPLKDWLDVKNVGRVCGWEG